MLDLCSLNLNPRCDLRKEKIIRMSDKESSGDQKKPIVVKNATDLQRLKLEKLMKNPEKPVILPDPPKSKTLPQAPDFVRNVMGSSAGAGSGEFHVYRHLRRKEYARQKFIQEKSEKEKLDEEYHMKIENNRRQAEERTAKKRAKRLKKKKLIKLQGKKAKIENKQLVSSSQSDSDEKQDDNIKSNYESVENKESDEKYLKNNEVNHTKVSEYKSKDLDNEIK